MARGISLNKYPKISHRIDDNCTETYRASERIAKTYRGIRAKNGATAIKLIPILYNMRAIQLEDYRTHQKCTLLAHTHRTCSAQSKQAEIFQSHLMEQGQLLVDRLRYYLPQSQLAKSRYQVLHRRRPHLACAT